LRRVPELTGECESLARGRFTRYLKRGDRGFSGEVLCKCLDEVGWKVDETVDEFPNDEESFGEFWRSFRGEGAFFYKVEGNEIGHCVAVRSGGIVFDPGGGPEEGEFMLAHLRRYGRYKRNEAHERTAEVTPGRLYKVSKK